MTFACAVLGFSMVPAVAGATVPAAGVMVQGEEGWHDAWGWCTDRGTRVTYDSIGAVRVIGNTCSVSYAAPRADGAGTQRAIVEIRYGVSAWKMSTVCGYFQFTGAYGGQTPYLCSQQGAFITVPLTDVHRQPDGSRVPQTSFSVWWRGDGEALLDYFVAGDAQTPAPGVSIGPAQGALGGLPSGTTTSTR